APPEELGKLLTGVGEREELAQVLAAGELRLLGEYGRLAEQHGLALRAQRHVEELIALLDEDVEQLADVGGAVRAVPQARAERGADLGECEPGEALVEQPGHLGDGVVGNVAACLEEERAHRATLQ